MRISTRENREAIPIHLGWDFLDVFEAPLCFWRFLAMETFYCQLSLVCWTKFLTWSTFLFSDEFVKERSCKFWTWFLCCRGICYWETYRLSTRDWKWGRYFFLWLLLFIFLVLYSVVGINSQTIIFQDSPDLFEFIQNLMVKFGYEVWNYFIFCFWFLCVFVLFAESVIRLVHIAIYTLLLSCVSLRTKGLKNLLVLLVL